MAVKDENSLSGMAQFDFFTELVLQACLQWLTHIHYLAQQQKWSNNYFKKA